MCGEGEYIFSVVSSEKILISRYRDAIHIGYRSAWNTCSIYTCEIFRLTSPKVTPLTISRLDLLSAYPLYSLYSILRPIWTGECKYPNLSYRFYDFYDRFHYTVEVRPHECSNSAISTVADAVVAAHTAGRVTVDGLKTRLDAYSVNYCWTHYGALMSSTDK